MREIYSVLFTDYKLKFCLASYNQTSYKFKCFIAYEAIDECLSNYLVALKTEPPPKSMWQLVKVK